MQILKELDWTQGQEAAPRRSKKKDTGMTQESLLECTLEQILMLEILAMLLMHSPTMVIFPSRHPLPPVPAFSKHASLFGRIAASSTVQDCDPRTLYAVFDLFFVQPAQAW